ncbi:MAG TPA: S9 family peptidase [Jatrophihabitans sp.]|nr:S9 family peptidase [Jatrophihabitans sp.]
MTDHLIDSAVLTPTDRLVQLLELRRSIVFDVADDGRLLVGNDDTGSVQLYEVALDGSWRQLTDLGEPCQGRYLPGTCTVVLSADTGGTERSQLSLIRPEQPGPPEPLVHDPAYIHSLLDVTPDRVVYATNRRNGVDFDVVAREWSTGQEQVLWDGGGYVSSAALSPDGRWAVVGRVTALAASSELLLIDAADGSMTPITDATVPGEWANARWLPDSSALLASSDAGSEFVSLRRFDLDRRAWTVLIEEPAANVYGRPSPDGTRLAVVVTADGTDRLRIDELTGSSREVQLPHPGSVSYAADPVWAPDSSALAMTFLSPIQPPEVYRWSGGEAAVRCTTSNPDSATTGLIQPESYLVSSPDGEQIPTYAIRPPNADGSAVLIIHGGPESATVRSWNPVAAALALAGHTVVLPNVRGSAGYGRRWVSLDDVEKRLDSVADLVALRDWLPTIGVDQDRAALYGGSYGGYMVLAGLTFYPELWAAGVDIVGISSLVTFIRNTSSYRRAYREREYGRLVEDHAVLEQASPLRIIDQIRAPLLVIHGANDPRVPLSEAEQVVAAVRASGAECQLLVYPDEGHGLAKRANQLDAFPQALEFLARHLAPKPTVTARSATGTCRS